MKRVRSAYVELADAIRELIDERAESAPTPTHELWAVKASAPLIVESDEGVVLEEGDPDFEVGSLVRAYRAQFGLAAGDGVFVVETAGGWAVVGVQDERETFEAGP